MIQYDVVILGGGPAGITAAIYCKRANLSCLLIDNYAIGGNINNYVGIENIPGFGKAATEIVVENFIRHLNSLDIEYREFEDGYDLNMKDQIIAFNDKSKIQYRNLIIATGSHPRQLPIPIAEECLGHIHYCAICDGYMYKDKEIVIVGGGNSACEEALGLAKICKMVTILEASPKLNADSTTQDQIYTTENIQVFVNQKIQSVQMVEDQLELTIKNDDPKIHFRDDSNRYYSVQIDGIFVYIGMSPCYSGDIEDYMPIDAFDKQGFIITDENMETKVPNVYAVGDVRSKTYRQVVTAMSDGAIAAIAISKKG